MIDIPKFIAAHVTGREQSLFEKDVSDHKDELESLIGGRSMLVIGGGGSIGSAFIKSALAYRPAKLVVADLSENALAELVRDLRSSALVHTLPPDFRTYPISYADVLTRKIFESEGNFDIVANFAAHKHVRSEKDVLSIQALLYNNVIHAREFLELLRAYPPSHFFCVSTDKAAAPVNVMGASKALMERMLMAYAKDFKVTTARFANVAFSGGSLLAGFLERIAKGQPLSAPEDIKRYFVSAEEAGELCLLACMLGQSGEILIPKLDARTMKPFVEIGGALLREFGYEVEHHSSEEDARLAAEKLGFESGKKYPFYTFKSDTSGEKEEEEFAGTGESVDWSRFREVGVIRNAPDLTRDEAKSMVSQLEELFARPDCSKEDIIVFIRRLVPDFSHLEKGASLDERM